MEVELEGIALHYEIYGKGRPLLILPGWAASARFSAHFKESLFGSLAGWRRLYVDPPGHGRTLGAPGITNMDGILELLVSFVDAVLPGQSYAVAGYSAGAYLARGLLYLRPEQIDGLFMCAPVIVADDAERDTPQHSVVVEEPDLDLGDEETAAALLKVATVRTQSALEPFVERPDSSAESNGDPGFRQWIRTDHERYAFSFDVDDLQEPFPRPLLIVAGRQDSVVGFRDAWRILDNFPRATFIVFDRAGHLLEEKAALNRMLVREWMDRVEEVSA